MDHPAPNIPHSRIAATLTWLTLIALTLASVAASARGAEEGVRLAMSLMIAVLCAIKAELLVRHFLHVADAGPLFSTLVRAFAAIVPLALVFSALRERWPL